jgi:CubicO group peptidase (beta-lactamase class C family)
MHRLTTFAFLLLLPTGAVAADPAPNVRETIDRGLTFLVKDSLAFKEKRKCAECHHAPVTIWALNEGKKRGYTVDERALTELTAWAAANDIPVKTPPAQGQIDVNEAPLLLALGIEAGDAGAHQERLKKMLASLLSEQGVDGSWKLSYEFRPIGSSPETLTALGLLALSAPNAPDMGQAGNAARQKALQWLRTTHRDDELQVAALRLILWRRLGRPATEWEPLVKKLRDAQNADGGWGQTSGAKSDAYATGQALYALAEAGANHREEAVQRAHAVLAKAQRDDGGWAMVSRAIMRDGKPPKDLGPITHAGSAWAVMGLVRTAPRLPERGDAELLNAAEGKPDPGKPPAVAAITDRLRKYVDAKEIAGAVGLVVTSDGGVHISATGSDSLDPPKAMRTDSIFWIASMSKPVLATLLLMLQDEGLLSVDDPVEKHLPEFKELKTADGKPARVTIRHLLTHTSGMGEITAAQARDSKTLADVIPRYVARPVAFTPGSNWVYCQSGINTGGRIAEVVTREPLDKLLQRRLFGPLGMKDTTFYLTEEQLPRLARSYRRTDKGELEATDIAFLGGKYPTSRDRFPAPNGGLFSTAPDYARFCQMVLRGGELEGKRYLKPETVKLMTTIETADLKTGFTPGNGWGLGWCVVREPQGVTAMLSPGTFGHGGAYGTQAWIDPTAKRIYILMVQRSNFPNSDASEVRKGFQEAASGAFSHLNKK